MTDTSYPVPTITGHEYTPVSPPLNGPIVHHRHGVLILDGTQEDDGQISCLCGYADDDGMTVACDLCNRWQHQLCYYPHYEDQRLPDDLQHYCVECKPRPFDKHGARARQQVKREEQASLANGIRRQAPKSHKKKIKEPAFANGWPLDKSRHDRNSASPRDQPPPAKRPKTSHRASDSTTTVSAKGHSRKRTATNVNHRRSLSRSPETPIDFYSEEFMRCYLEDQWAVTHANLHNSLAVGNALLEWLNSPDDIFRDMHGHEKTEVLMRWDRELDDIPGKAQLEIRELHDVRVRDEENNHPTWKMVTVKESVASGAYLGELTGHVDFKEQYQRDPSNRWPLLRHPEPFVFFHPRLPIYIDARNEGTELRYVRRSCVPNARLQVLVTNQKDYRFCFMATQQIDPDMEVSVAWDTSDGLPELMRRSQNGISESDMDQLSSWVSTVLANCGPCACQLHNADCMMSRFDRRGLLPDYEEEAQSVKTPKAKRKKAGLHISPLNTHVNSRSGSEARKGDLDDEPTDSRSASGSAGRGSASRDITPNTHYSHNGSLSTMPELSERERKKLAKEEEMFRRQEEEQQTGKHSKKKRNSGSTVNTPSATSSKQLGFGGGSSKYADAGTSKQSGLPSSKPAARRPKGPNAPKTPSKTVITRVVKRPKPDYVDQSVQCDMDKEEAERRVPALSSRRPFLSTTQRLLQRCALNNNARRKRDASASVVEAAKSLKAVEKMEVDHPVPLDSPSSKVSSPMGTVPEEDLDPEPEPEPEPEPVPRNEAFRDAEMQDGDFDKQPPPVHIEPAEAAAAAARNLPKEDTRIFPSPYQVDPPGPPWPSQASHSTTTTQETLTSPILLHRPPTMHLQMPPPPPNPFAAASQPASLSADTPNSITGSLLQSPSSVTGPTASSAAAFLSPAVNNVAGVIPSPAKKKLSLSEYSKKRRIEASKAERESSPASGPPGVGQQALQLSSSAIDMMGKVADGASSAIGEDVAMEDAGGGGDGDGTSTAAAAAAATVVRA